MAATRIRVRFKEFSVDRNADLTHGGEWVFEASVCRKPGYNPVPFGDRDSREVNVGDSVALDWPVDLDIEPDDQTIEIRLSAYDEDWYDNDPLGVVLIVLNNPILHEYDLWLRSSLGYFYARVQVKILQQTGAGGGSVTTIRGRLDSDTYSTVHDGMLDKLVHVCPVIPVPWATGIPPLARGVKSLTASPQESLGITGASQRLNSLVNPALIPVLDPTTNGFSDRCARVRITQFRPHDLDLSKLIWKAASGNIRFWQGGQSTTEVRGGREVNVYGVLSGNE